MIKFTQSIITALRGGSWPMTAETKVVTRATMFTVSWNWRNLRMLSKTHRPQVTALTIEEKLSSMMMMSEASLATSVPEMPIAKPTSAARSAGPSLVPSPVTPTTSPSPSCLAASHSSRWPGRTRSRWVAHDLPGCCSSHAAWPDGKPPFNRDTSKNLSSGLLRARTWSRGNTASSCAGDITRKSEPVMARPPSRKMPHSLAMATAVSRLSPVTMRTVMPARWHVLTASGTSGRSGSWIATSAAKQRPE
mmetsp:Transcript_47982/g.108934  ORF Transcript_47982/g.108934 Transcript_47982/m.108934 type:complete len:249 (-) Transcript_47982:1724-2470(-)